MSRLSKILWVSVVVVFILACNFVTRPINDVQNLAETAQSIGSTIPIETLQALPSAIPAETLQALGTKIPDLENIFDPQGAPLQEWKGIPVMPQATAGQEFTENNTYSFKANVTIKEVQDFYNEKLTTLGWTQPFEFPLESDGGIMVFQKESSTLTMTIVSSEGSTVVVLTLA